MKTLEPNYGKAAFRVLYLAECNGICRPHAFSSEDLERYGGEAGLEAMLANEYDWFECLGIVCGTIDRFGGRKPTFNVCELETLIAHSSRKMMLIDDNEFEYVPADGLVMTMKPPKKTRADA